MFTRGFVANEYEDRNLHSGTRNGPPFGWNRQTKPRAFDVRSAFESQLVVANEGHSLEVQATGEGREPRPSLPLHLRWVEICSDSFHSEEVFVHVSSIPRSFLASEVASASMARPLRLEHPGAFHHVMSRGNDGIPIFRDDADHLRFLDLLVQSIERFGWLLHDWTLMTNHYHLIIETPECTLSDGMHWLLGRYAQWFNRRHRRRGHLFGERFKNILVDRDTYLLTLSRYLALNPVKAGMTASPEEYPWSSYRARAGYETVPSWLTIQTVESLFDPQLSGAREEYRKFVCEGLNETGDLLDEVIGQMYLGGAAFVERMQKFVDESERSEEMLRAQVHPARPELEDVVSAVAQTFDTTAEKIVQNRGSLERRVIAYVAFEDGLVQLRRIAQRLGVNSAGGISGLVSRFRRELEHEPHLRELLAGCRSRMPRRPVDFLLSKTPQLTARRYHHAQSAKPRLR
jgi:putative transposase